MDEYPTDFVSIGTVEDVYTTHVTHQEQFYIHLDTRSSILEEIMDKLETRYSQLGPNDKILPQAQIRLGGLCAAKFTDDNNWYRVKITGLLNNGLIEVNFVDYGNTDYVGADRVKKLDPDLMQYPVQSYKCALAGVSCQHGLWTPELRVQFEDLVVDKQCKAVFTGKSEEDIYLLDMYDEKGTYINKLFGAAEKTCSAMDPMVNRNGSHVAQGFDTVVWREGIKVQAVVVYVTSPDVFWCQEVEHTNDIIVLSEELSRLHMTQKMGLLQDIRPGAICAAKSHEDQAWYRGIIQSLSRNQAQVYFVDYGNSETVGIESICELKPQFRVLPALAVKCSLCSLRTSDGKKWSPEATEEFEKMVVDKEFELSVIGKRHDGYDVSLLDIEENRDVGSRFKEIISRGGIKARTPPKPDNVNNNNQSQSKSRGLDLAVGSTSDVFLSWIDNPADFWVQLDKASDTLDKLSSELQEYYATSRPTALSAPGAFVIARFSEDQQWYRGLVVKEFDDLVKVLFIDYGNADTIPKSEVRQVNPQFGQIDPLAFRCSLKGIKPLPQDNSWSVDAKDFLEKLTENGCQCEVLSKNDAYRFVNLKVDGKDVTQELVSLAVVAGSQSSSVKLNSHSYSPSPRLQENQTEQAVVTHVDSPHNFWVQLSRSISDLDAVMEKLDNHYSEEGGTPVSRPAVGQACVAQYSLDNAWYRAVITNINPSGCNVHFVDYGNSEVVTPNLVCVAEPRFLDLPCQAIKCRLPLPGDVSSLTNDLSDLVLEKDVSLKVIAGGEVPTVDLITDGQSVCSILKNQSRSHNTQGQSNGGGVSGLKPAKPIPQGSTVKAFTSFVHNPGRFFLQLSGVDEELSSLMDQLTQQYVPQGVPTVSQPSVGMPCVALYQDDNQWYRGKITCVHGDQCQVLFVDYGNEELVDNGSIKVLTPEVSILPILAYQCSLRGVQADEWSESSIECFESLVMDQELSCNFITQSEVTISCNGEDIAQKLISAGYCRHNEGLGTKSPLSVSTQSSFGGGRQPKSPGFGQSPRKEGTSPESFSGGKKEGRGFGDNREEKRGFQGGRQNDSFGENREENKGFGGGRQEGQGFGGGGRRFGGGDDGSGFGGKRGGGDDGGSGFGGSRRDRNTDSSSTVATDKFTYADPPSEPESAILVHIDDDGTFYLQLPSMEKDILFLSKRMAGSYKSGGPRLKGMAEKGSICCCKFPDDGNMYRCQVEEIDGNKVLVRYMDFGNLAEHSTFDLKFMFPDLLQYPVQAFPCKLRGFDWSLDKADTFGVSTLDKDLEVTFTSAGPPFLVDIKTPDGDLLSIMTGKIAPPAPKVSSPCSKTSGQADGGGFGAKSPKGFGSRGGMETSTPKKFDSPEKRSFNQASSPAKPKVPKQVFLSQTVSSGSETAFISHVSEDGYFYLQLEKDTELLDSLTEKLSNLNSDSPHPDLSKGAACAAVFSEDSSWYRAKISEVHSNEFTVTFVDFGNGDKVSKENIRPLNEDLLSAAPLAYQCLFEGENETLSDTSKVKLEEFLLEHQMTVSFNNQSAPFVITATTSDGQDLHEIVCPSNRFRSHVIPKDVTPAGVCHIEDDGRIFICFYKQYKAKANLQKRLQGHYSSAEVEPVEDPEVDSPCCFKSSSDDLWHRCSIKSLVDSKAEVQYVDIGRTESVETSDLKTLPSNFLKEPPFALECRLKGVDSWTSDLKEKFIDMTEDKIMNATFYTTSPPFRVSLARSIELDLLGLSAPQPDSPKRMVDDSVIASVNMNRSATFQGGDSYITEITPQGIFFAQLVSEEEQLQVLSDNLEALLASEQTEPEIVEVGNLLFAKFSEDDVWYRAIIEEEDGDKFTVRFVDYGNTDTLSKNRLASLPDELNTISIPAFAYKCKLPTQLTQVEEFKASLLDKMVSIEIVSTEDDGIFNVNVILDGQPITVDQEIATDQVSEKHVDKEENIKPVSSQRTTVIVPYVTTPSQFYVQLQAEENQLDSMMNDLFEDLTGQAEGEGLVPDDLAIGDLCAALYDESWYRARVISFGAVDESIQVLYVDHGNAEIVSDRSELRALPDKYKSLPLFGHEAALPGIKPVDEDWTDEAIEAFKALVEEKSLLADLLDVCDDKPWTVQLLDMGTPVQDTLITKGHGMAVESVAVSDSTKHVFSEASESSLVLAEVPAESNICKRKIGSVLDKVEELKEVKVFVSHVNNPSEMWCQLASSTDELEELADKMETLYETTLESDILEDINTGDLVVGLFEDDGMRYRSVVTDKQISDSEKVLLRFIDYGNSGSCARGDILKIRDELCNQSALSFSCCLDKIQPEEGVWSEDVCNRLTELTTEQELLLTLVGRKQDGTALVDLVIPETCKSLSGVLIEEGLVKTVEEDTSLAVASQEVEKGDVSECLEITQPIMESTAMVDEATPNNDLDYSFGYTDDGYFRCVELNLLSRYDIIVCNDELPNAFCVQLRDLEDQLLTLSEEIQDFVNNNEDVKYSPKVGDACLVKHNNEWQRALIRMENDNSCYVVYAVDIGWELIVKSDLIRSMPSQFLDFPGQAIHCYLAGIVSMEPEWSAEAIDFFTDYIRDHDLHINVLESAEDGKYGVSMSAMLDSSSEYTGSSLNQLMIELGHSDVVPGSNMEVQYDMERTLDSDMLDELEESFKEVEKNMENKVKEDDETDASTSRVDTFANAQEEGRMACKAPLEAGSQFYQLVHVSKSEAEDERNSGETILTKKDMAFSIASAVDRIDQMGCIDLFPDDGLPFDLTSDVDSVLENSIQNRSLTSKENERSNIDVQPDEKTPQKCNIDISTPKENKSPLYTWSQPTSPENNKWTTVAKMDDTGDSVSNEDKISISATDGIDHTGDRERFGTLGLVKTSECCDKMESDELKNGPVNEGSNTDAKPSKFENKLMVAQFPEKNEQPSKLEESFEALPIEQEERELLPYEYYEKLESTKSATAIMKQICSSNIDTALRETDCIPLDLSIKRLKDGQINTITSSQTDHVSKDAKMDGLVNDVNEENDDLKRKNIDKDYVIVGGGSECNNSCVLIGQECHDKLANTENRNTSDNHQDVAEGEGEILEISKCDESASYLTLDQTGFIDSTMEERDLTDGYHGSASEGISSGESASTFNLDLDEDEVKAGCCARKCGNCYDANGLHDSDRFEEPHLERNCAKVEDVSYDIAKVMGNLQNMDHPVCNGNNGSLMIESKHCESEVEKNMHGGDNEREPVLKLNAGRDVQVTLSCKEKKNGIDCDSVCLSSGDKECSDICDGQSENYSLPDTHIQQENKIIGTEEGNVEDGLYKNVGMTGMPISASSDSTSVEDGSMFESCLEPESNCMEGYGNNKYENKIDHHSHNDVTEEISGEEPKHCQSIMGNTAKYADGGLEGEEEEEEDGLATSISTLDDTNDNYESASETFEDTDRTDSFYNTDGSLMIDECTEIDSSIDRSGLDSSHNGPDESSCYDTSSLIFSDSQVDSSYLDSSNTYTSTSTFEDSNQTAELDSISSLSIGSPNSMVNALSDVKAFDQRESVIAETNAIKGCEKQDDEGQAVDFGQELGDDIEMNESLLKSELEADDSIVTQDDAAITCAARQIPINELEQHKSEVCDEGNVKAECLKNVADCLHSVAGKDQDDNERVESEMPQYDVFKAKEVPENEIPQQASIDEIVKDFTHDRQTKVDSDHSGPTSFHSADEEEEVIRGNLEESATAKEGGTDSDMKVDDNEGNASNADEMDDDCTGDVAPKEVDVAEEKEEEDMQGQESVKAEDDKDEEVQNTKEACDEDDKAVDCKEEGDDEITKEVKIDLSDEKGESLENNESET